MQDSAPRQLKLADVEQAKDAMLQNAAQLVKCTVPQLLNEGGDAPEQKMGSTCFRILGHVLKTCQKLRAPFFAFGAGYYTEVLAAMHLGFDAGGVEVVPHRVETFNKMLSVELEDRHKNLFTEAIDLTVKPIGKMFDFIDTATAIKMNDEVFQPELRNRVVAEFAECPSGSVLFASTNWGTATDDRLTPWQQVEDPLRSFRSVGYHRDKVQPLWKRTVKDAEERAHNGASWIRAQPMRRKKKASVRYSY
jgi:hypothetical protein